MDSPESGQPADSADVRAAHSAVVLRHVRAFGPCSRSDIAASTGINKATVSGIVARLIERRVLREIGSAGHKVGRPAIQLALDGTGYVGIGIEIGVDHLTVVAVDLAGRQVLNWRRSFRVPGTHPGRVIVQIAGLAQRATARIRDSGGDVFGLTIAVPGLVDSTGTVRSAPPLGWTDIELRDGVKQAMFEPDHPIVIDNDAMLGAIAEHRFGTHAGTDHLTFLAGGVGVINNGVPLRGANGYVGTVAGFGVMLPWAGDDPGDDIAQQIELHLFARKVAAGDTDAVNALAELGAGLGHAVALLVDLLNPTTILLGGHYAALAPWLLPLVERQFRPLAAAPHTTGVHLAASTLGQDAPALGGAAVALDALHLALFHNR